MEIQINSVDKDKEDKDKDSLKRYLKDTKIRSGMRYVLKLLFRRYFSYISHDLGYRVLYH